MRTLCCFSLVTLLAAFPVAGKAVTAKIQDPTYASLTSSPTSFSFTACPTQADPGGPYLDHGVAIASDGCFGAVNESAATISSIELTFQNTTAVQNSGPNAASSDIFSQATFIAPADPKDSSEDFTFLFSGNGLVEGQAFVITEDGVTDPSQFPLVTVTYITAGGTSVTPEPSSLLLMSTGLLGGTWFYRRRQHA